MCSPIRRRAAGIVLGSLAALALCVGPATATTLVPPKGNLFFGVSDKGTAAEFNEFAGLVGKHPAVMQTFHPWGNSLNAAVERWGETAVRPMLHISTADDQTLAEIITPQQIAQGEGDDYLLQLNQGFAKRGLRAYIRPLGEPNRCRNVYSGFNCDGTPKRGEHYPYWYKQAFRRIVAIVRGGGTIDQVNATLAEIGLPPVRRTKGPPPASLPLAPVAVVWSPLPAGSPRVKGNWPGNYWPGSRWVDWVGTDIYSQYPVWVDLNHFVAGKQWRGKPIALTEWAASGSDDTRFTRQLFAWTFKRPRVRMLTYYQGFGTTGNLYALGLYPQTEALIRHKIRRRAILPYAPYFAPPVVEPEPVPAPTPVPAQ
ncbi:MAG TPA: hypothetical protein VF176_00095 [Solirubrobacterales bacterium]